MHLLRALATLILYKLSCFLAGFCPIIAYIWIQTERERLHPILKLYLFHLFNFLFCEDLFIFLYVSMCVRVGLCILYINRCLWRPQGIGPPGTGVTGRCKMPDVGSGSSAKQLAFLSTESSLQLLLTLSWYLSMETVIPCKTPISRWTQSRGLRVYEPDSGWLLPLWCPMKLSPWKRPFLLRPTWQVFVASELERSCHRSPKEVIGKLSDKEKDLIQ